jgi:predicted RecA/RadA family phage recombinase
MKAIYVQEGKAIDYTPTADTPAGSVVVIGEIAGITKLDIAAGALGALHLVGVYNVEKASVAITLGAEVYWNGTQATNAATSGSGESVTNNALLGIAIEAASAADSTVKVRIG